MTLDDYRNLICATVGQTDANSVSLCTSYLQRRYQTIWDKNLWNDSRRIDAFSTVVNQNFVPLPSGVDRVISIRCNGDHFIDPIDATFAVEANPSIFEQTGIPQYYEEYTDPGDKLKKIKLYPTPNAVFPLLIVGKGTLPQLLLPQDVPVLRNIDNALIAYATGDMLERQRQYAKAQAKYTEAQAALDDAIALEKAQTNVPRKIKNLTVAGNSLAELTDAVAARIGVWQPDARIMIQEFLRRNYQVIYDSLLWPESMVVATVNSDGSQIVLPEYIDRVVALRGDANLGQLGVSDISAYFATDPQIFERTTGPQYSYSMLTPVGVSVLPPTREFLSFVSTSTADNGNMFVKGESAGLEVSETVVLNGTTPVHTVNMYDVPLTVSKLATTGDVIVTGATSSVTLERILAKERERRHIRLWLQSTDVARQCLVLGKRKIKPLVQDEDTPMISGIQMPLIYYACAESLALNASASSELEAADSNPAGYRSRSQALNDMAQSMRQQGDAALKSLIDQETRQNTTSQRVIPYVDYPTSHFGSYNDYYYDSYFIAK